MVCRRNGTNGSCARGFRYFVGAYFDYLRASRCLRAACILLSPVGPSFWRHYSRILSAVSCAGALKTKATHSRRATEVGPILFPVVCHGEFSRLERGVRGGGTSCPQIAQMVADFPGIEFLSALICVICGHFFSWIEHCRAFVKSTGIGRLKFVVFWRRRQVSTEGDRFFAGASPSR